MRSTPVWTKHKILLSDTFIKQPFLLMSTLVLQNMEVIFT